MSAHTVDRLHLAILDGHLLDDATLARLVPECRSLTAFTTGAGESGLAQRWAAIAPGVELIDGGHVANLREALVECAKRRIVVISTGVPKDAATFVALALQGAAAMTEFEIPGVAVHVMRPVERPGTVAWLTDTGELSGYGVLFAVGYAHLHDTGLDLIEPSGGLDRPRTAEALDDALAFAEAAGVPITRHTDPSPFARVLRDEHCLVVHPVLDAPKGFNLLHPGELSRKAVATGNPAVVVELLEQFPGDVVAVFDGVHLLSGSIPAARIAAGVALGVVAAAGIGTMVASPAMATTISQSAHAGVSVIATGHNGTAHPGNFHVENSLDHAVTLTLTANWVSSGNHPVRHTTVSNVAVQPGQTVDVAIPRPTDIGKGSYHIGSTDYVVTHHHETPQQVTPEKAPDPVIVTGTIETFTDYSPVIPVVGVPGTTETELETTDHVPQLIPPDPVVQQVPQAVPQAIPQPQAPDLVAPPLQPPLTPQVPQAVPQAIPQPQAPDLVAPPLPPPLTPQAPQAVPQAIPTPGHMVDEPVLVPPVRGTISEITQSGVSAVVTSVVTPEGVAEVGGVVLPGTTSEVLTAVTTETGTPVLPGTTTTSTADTGVTRPVGHGPTTPAAHHRTTPTVVTDGASGLAHHAPAGELAHTGGNTAILAIVAGSLLAAGAGLAVAGRIGKDDPDTGVTEG